MQAIILNPELFIQYKSEIGIMLYTENDSKEVNFFTGHKHIKVDRSQTELVSIQQIEDAVIANDHLRELAEDHNLVEIHHDDEPEEYMEYYSSFN